jgi:predicted aspartyl protease
VELNGRLVEVILDSGGARTMVDKETAKALGLNVEWATPEKSFGSFSGVSPGAN